MATLLGNVLKRMFGGSRGVLSNYTPQAPHQFGQPLPNQLAVDGYTAVTPARMREVVQKTPTVAACINAVLDYLVGIPIQIRNVDATQPANPIRVAFVRDYMNRPNRVDTWLHFCKKLFGDMLILGQAAVELEANTEGTGIAHLHVLDAGRLKIDYDQHGNILGYNMLDEYGRPITVADGVHTWDADELIYINTNPSSDSRYSASKINQLYTCALLEDLMIFFISQKFTDTNIPFGVYDIGDVTEDELIRAVDNWNDQATNAAHRVMITGSRSGGKWNVFGYHLKDLEAVQLLAEIRGKIMAVLGVTLNELGESQDVNKSNGYNLSFTFKKRALEPVLDEFCSTLTQKLLWEKFGFTDLEFFYPEIDSRDELLQAQIDEIYVRLGVLTPNQIMNRRGDPSVPGGDEHLFIIGNVALPLDMLRAMGEAQLQAIQAAAMGGPDGEIKGAPIRGIQPPKSENNESVRIHYQPKKNTSEVRGTAQALQRTGLRKESL